MANAFQNIRTEKIVEEVFENKFDIGGILYYNAGWTMGIPTWLRIVRMTGQTVWVEKLQDCITSDDGYGQNGNKRPLLTAKATPVKGCFRIRTDSCGEKSICPDKYHTARLWNGKEQAFYTD